MLKLLVIFAGAILVTAKLGIIGWLCHRGLLKHAPGLAAFIPPDGGAILGLLAGAALVAAWAVG